MQPLEIKSRFKVQAEIDIHAPLEHIWSILIAIDRYHEWNSFVPVMESSFEVGSLLTMHIQMRSNLRTKSVETITAIEPYYLLAWQTRSPACFLRGERYQVITAIDAHTTHYQTREAFTGIFAPVLKLMFYKDLQRNFETMAQDLKREAERTLF